MALGALPAQARPRPQGEDGLRLLARSYSAGAIHTFAAACRERGVNFSLAFAIIVRIQAVVDDIPAEN